MSRRKTKERSIGRRAEFARLKIQLEEIRETGRGLAVQLYKGRNNKFVLTMRYDRKPVLSTKDGRYVVKPGRTADESVVLRFLKLYGPNFRGSQQGVNYNYRYETEQNQRWES